jgi:hypothetical protein
MAVEAPIRYMTIVEHERTSTEIIMYCLYSYFLGLSFRNTSRALQHLQKGVMWQYGNGYRSLIQNRSIHVRG